MAQKENLSRLFNNLIIDYNNNMQNVSKVLKTNLICSF